MRRLDLFRNIGEIELTEMRQGKRNQGKDGTPAVFGQNYSPGEHQGPAVQRHLLVVPCCAPTQRGFTRSRTTFGDFSTNYIMEVAFLP